MNEITDPILKSIVRELREKHRCHTVLLYGSRARGLTTPTSDYDCVGIRRSGEKFRIAKKQKGFFWDVFVYPEKDLRKLDAHHFSWKGAQVLHQDQIYGTKLLGRLDRLLKMPFKPVPSYEIDVVKIWAQKELERCRMNDIQGFFRRAEFLAALVDHYFMVRQKRFLGPKEGFTWIAENDSLTFQRLKRALKYPTNISFLKTAASRVYKVSLT
jgi:uncharacterized protein